MHDTLDELWLDAASHLLTWGHQVPSRDGHTTEIMGYVGRLADPKANFMFNPVRRMSPSYAAGELLWYLSGSRSIEMIKTYAAQYERFADEEGNAYGAYGYRWAMNPGFRQELAHGWSHTDETRDFDHILGKTSGPDSQVTTLLRLLRAVQDTRQAVLVMWDSGDLVRAYSRNKKDLPCTLSLNFLVRDNKLFLTTTMRSNDIWLGLPYDVWAFTCLQQLIAEGLGLELGWYQHQAMSLHVYDRNEAKFREAAAAPSFNTGGLAYDQSGVSFHEGIDAALRLERFARESKICPGTFNPLSPQCLLTQCVVMASTKWGKVKEKRVSNKLMLKYLEELGHVDN